MSSLKRLAFKLHNFMVFPAMKCETLRRSGIIPDSSQTTFSCFNFIMLKFITDNNAMLFMYTYKYLLRILMLLELYVNQKHLPFRCTT